MSVVMTGQGKFVEIQGTAETNPFSREESNQMLDLTSNGIGQLIRLQNHMILQKLDEANLGDT